MTDSILESVKKDVGVFVDVDDETPFDETLIRCINTALLALIQNGIGEEGFKVTGPENTWAEFLGEDSSNLEAAKEFVTIQTKLLFDHPSNSFVADSIKELANEALWRLNAEVDYLEEPE